MQHIYGLYFDFFVKKRVFSYDSTTKSEIMTKEM